MNVGELKTALSKPGIESLEIHVGGRRLESHFHITEVGKVIKDFVDCGGVRRMTESCQLQTLVANDTDHRLSAQKLLGILEKSKVLWLSGALEVELEVQGATIEIYSLASAEQQGNQLQLKLEPKNTACLAPDKCGLETVALNGDAQTQSCCGGGSC